MPRHIELDRGRPPRNGGSHASWPLPEEQDATVVVDETQVAAVVQGEDDVVHPFGELAAHLLASPNGASSIAPATASVRGDG